MKLSIIIINYKCEEYIDSCLNSIYFDGDYEIIIIDNENNPELIQKISKFLKV